MYKAAHIQNYYSVIRCQYGAYLILTRFIAHATAPHAMAAASTPSFANAHLCAVGVDKAQPFEARARTPAQFPCLGSLDRLLCVHRNSLFNCFILIWKAKSLHLSLWKNQNCRFNSLFFLFQLFSVGFMY